MYSIGNNTNDVLQEKKKKNSAQEKQSYFIRMVRKKFQENKTNLNFCAPTNRLQNI